MDNIYLWQKHPSKLAQPRNRSFPLGRKTDVFVAGGGMLLCGILAFAVFVSEN
jgi:hypothetical protein